MFGHVQCTERVCVCICKCAVCYSKTATILRETKSLLRKFCNLIHPFGVISLFSNTLRDVTQASKIYYTKVTPKLDFWALGPRLLHIPDIFFLSVTLLQYY